jgi:signal transduction histidine kinase
VALTRGRSAEHYFEVLQSNLEELERLRSIINDMLFLASADQGSKATALTEASLAEEVATTSTTWTTSSKTPRCSVTSAATPRHASKKPSCAGR